MVVAIARAEFHLPTSRSLKDKRRFLKSLIERVHHRLRVSIAETDFHDLRQRAEVGIALVHCRRADAEKRLDEIHRLFESQLEAHLSAWESDVLEEVS
jgi:uncharacterized protein YlxP (DUF503 family)